MSIEASTMVVRLLFIGSFLVMCSPVISLSCIPCSWERCSTPVNCKGGLVKSICGCCNVCAKVEGEICGGQWQTQGRCDSGLKCIVRDGHLKAAEGTCEPAVCKGKKCGFREVCTLGNDGFPFCTCPQTCSGYKYKPVCGHSNGKQYNNECELRKEECTSAKTIGVMAGPCKKCFDGTKSYSFGENRTGKNSCEQCSCFHGEWKCRTTAPCQQPKSRSCSVAVDTLGRTLQSDCPKGYWCKVQIPGIPEANIPEVAVCTSEHQTNIEGGSASLTSGSVPPTSQLEGQIPAQCLLAPHEGPCRAAYRRWYYNKEKRKCMVFVYGGCEGNANNFYTKPACKIFCMQRNRSSEQDFKQTHPPQIKTTSKPEPPIAMWTEVCYLPPVTGPCRASFPRWYYNSFNKKCSKFTYGGCKGNMNNFHTKVDCKKHCMKRKGKTRARAAIWYGTLRRRTSNFRKLSQG